AIRPRADAPHQTPHADPRRSGRQDLGRAQYARTVRPALGWRASWVPGAFAPDEPAWEVGVLNGGPQHAVVERVEYRLVPHDGVPGAWTDHAGLLRELAAMGLVHGKHYRQMLVGAGFPLPGATGYETAPHGAYTQRFVDEVDELRLRLRVTDAVGDSHERVMDLMRGARLERPGAAGSGLIVGPGGVSRPRA
ncbi:hypothetical protein O3Q52_53285, partial [Streptomyces sp. ActVer]|nr:hypothetical protein [Streptomyces sp. ActVer]